MSTLDSIFSYYIFSIVVFATIVFFDVMFTMKRPIILKAYFLLLTFCVGLFSFLVWYNHINAIILLSFPVLKFLIWSSMSLILSHLYIDKDKRWIYLLLLFAGVVLIFSVYQIYLFTLSAVFIDLDILMDPVLMFTQKFSFKLNLYPRLVLFFLFFTINLRIVYLIFKKASIGNVYYDKIKTWTKAFVALEFFSVCVFAVMNSILLTYELGNIMLIVLGYLILFIVYYRPRFINNQSLKLTMSNNFIKDKNTKITDVNFYTPFFINNYFLNEDATLEKFCGQNGIDSTEILQDYCVKYYNMSFANLVNKSRVNYFIDLVKSPKYKRYSIDALAIEAGFNSRHHLYKPFKKFHGGTPSDFINSINN
jgi:AraC-like DNA-binding protein